MSLSRYLINVKTTLVKIQLTAVLLILLAGAQLGCDSNSEKTAASVRLPDLRVPAEWEPQESVWLAWPLYDNKHDWSSTDAFMQLLEQLLPAVKVNLCVPDDSTGAAVYNALRSKNMPDTALGNLQVRLFNYADVWLRDTGPIIVKDAKGFQAVDFRFNSWGWGEFVTLPGFKEQEGIEESVDRGIAKLLNIPVRSSELILEGGAIEFNGRGTALVSEDVVFQRNPAWNKQQVEEEFRRLFGVNNLIWLKGYTGNDAHPVLNAPFMVPFPNGSKPVYTVLTTNGHADEFVRFADAGTLLLAEAPDASEAELNPISAQTRATLLNARSVLLQAKDQNGKAFKIKFMPEPKLLYATLNQQDEAFTLLSALDFKRLGKGNIDTVASIQVVLAASYCNFLVTNGLVLVAQYEGLDPELASSDMRARKVLEEAFPGRTIVGLDVRAFNIGGGGIHCITRNIPMGIIP
jgi:agmatine deiminase